MERRTTTPRGRHENPRRQPSLSLEHPIQQRRRLITDLFDVGIDARQRRVAQFALHVVVIHAEDRHLVGHGDSGLAAGGENLLGAHVIARHQPERLGQAAEPCHELVGVPQRVRFHGCQIRIPRHPRIRKHAPPQPPLGKLLDETCRAQIGERHAGESAVGKVSESAIQKMADRHAYEQLRIGRHPGNAFRLALGIHIHGRHVHAADLPRHAGPGKPSDDAVRFPLLQSRRNQIAEGAFLMEERPRPVRPGVGGDSLEHLPAVGTGRFDQQCHSQTPGHCAMPIPHPRIAFIILLHRPLHLLGVDRFAAAGERFAQFALAIVEPHVRQGAVVDLERREGGRTNSVDREVVLHRRPALAEELADCRPIVGVVEADGDYRQPRVAEATVQFDGVGKERQARPAPGGPKVDQHHLAAVLLQCLRQAGGVDRAESHVVGGPGRSAGTSGHQQNQRRQPRCSRCCGSGSVIRT